MQNKLPLFVIPVVILLALGGAGAWWFKSQTQSEAEADLAQAQVTEGQIETAAGEAPMPETMPAPEAAPTEVATPVPSNAGPVSVPAAAPVEVVVEGNDPKFPKAVGKLEAPITMYDFSSLTCPHCAHAHAEILPLLIKEYVETGKMRIVFMDFPLNQEAMDASKVARCMPNDKYYGFVSLLFSSIEQWVTNHPQALIQNAVMAGLPEDKARACLADTSVEQALSEGVKEAVNKYQVNATPTFVLNEGKKVLSGARPYIEFKMAIDGMLEELGANKE
ncbi:MAG: hypothetical protein EBQ96_07910 [Proteobacteria bacterium]|nr:hypothetical protein [Pseudomonadota bacterium]